MIDPSDEVAIETVRRARRARVRAVNRIDAAMGEALEALQALADVLLPHADAIRREEFKRDHRYARHLDRLGRAIESWPTLGDNP